MRKEQTTNFRRHPRDSLHRIVIGVHLEHGGELHRFEVDGHIPYSAIYQNGVELKSCPRKDEKRMIRRWNTEEHNADNN